MLLFHGASGVGKTMMANAVAKHVSRKVLLINFPSLGSNEAGTAICFIFRSAPCLLALALFPVGGTCVILSKVCYQALFLMHQLVWLCQESVCG